MRLGYLSHSISRKFGGVYETTRRTAQSLVKFPDCSVEVFGTEDKHTQEDLQDWHPIQPRVFKSQGFDGFGFNAQLSKSLQSSDLDLAHVQGLWTYPSCAARAWSRRNRRPFCVSVHGMLERWALNNSRWKKKLAGWAFQNGILQEAQCLHALTQDELSSVRDYNLRGPVCVIPNGTDLPGEHCSQPPPWTGKVEPDKKVLLYIGRYHPIKGLPNLICAWALARKESRAMAGDWNLVLIGWNQENHENELRTLIRDLGMDDCIHILGPHFGDAKLAAYHHASGFVLTSYSEGLPMVALEAMAHRLPLLMTRECRLPEAIQSGAAITLSLKAEKMALDMQPFFEMQNSELKTMGSRGRDLVANRYSWTKVAAELRAVYNWMLGGGDAPDCVVRNGIKFGRSR